MLLPILLIEGADDDPLTCAGMNEFPVFQVDAHMGGPFLFPPVVEEDEVAFANIKTKNHLHFFRNFRLIGNETFIMNFPSEVPWV